MCTYVELPHPPTPPFLYICTDLGCKPAGCYVDLLPRLPSPCSTDPLNCTVLCSSVLDSTFVVNEDQAIEKFDVTKPNFSVIYNEYD